MVDAVASYLQTVVVHPIQTGPRVSQSKYAEHGTSGHRQNCIQHTKQQTLDGRTDHTTSARAMNRGKKKQPNRKSKKKKKEKHQTRPSPGPRCKKVPSSGSWPESELRRASELPLYIRWTDFKLSLLRLSRLRSTSKPPSATPLHPFCFFTFFFLWDSQLFRVGRIGANPRSRGTRPKKFSFKETLLVMSPPQHRIPSHSHRTPMKKKQNTHTSQATWRERERLWCFVVWFFLFLSLYLSTRELPADSFCCCLLFYAAVALRSFSLSCSPSQK